MNCQELARALEEQDLDQLPAEQRRLAEAHLAGCPESIRYVQLQKCLAALPVPRLGSERIAEWREVAVREAVARTGRRRRRARLLVIGGLVTAATLTALVVMHLSQPHLSQPPELPRVNPEFHQP